jgi:D-3-phosphoglycerate dehydrogenase
MKKILIVGDDYIGSDYMKNGFAPWQEQGYALVERNWLHGGMEKMSEMNRVIEREGPEAVPVDDEVFDEIQDAEILIVQFMPVPAKLIDSAPKLKYIGTLRTGLENIDIDYAKERGIAVFNTPGRLAETVSDYTIGFMLCEARNIARGHAALRQESWRRDYSNNAYVPEMQGRTVGLVGFGHIAQSVARKLGGFNMNIIAVDPFVSQDVADKYNVKLVDMDRLMAESDFVSVHVNLNSKTRHLIGAHELSLMKKTAVIVNTARGPVIDEDALIAALQEKRIGGAALDVFEEEPPAQNSPLYELDNVTITPHLAGTSVDCMINSPKMLANAMQEELIEGKESGFRVGNTL